MPDFDPDELEALMAAMQQLAVVPELGPLGDEHPEVVRALQPMHPIKTAATFAGLLMQKGLQSNCVRLEVLVHLCIAHCHGTKSAPASLIAQVFRAMGSGRCGRAEDPAEDVFVSNVFTDEGNFRVLEGVWESAGFFLQRVLNVTKTLPPDQEPFRRLRASVHALLKLSDAACERAGLRRYERGNANPEDAIPSKIMDRLAAGRRHVRFSTRDLSDLGVEKELLTPFIFGPKRREALGEQTVSHTDLERRPLAWHDDELVLLLPTAVSAAIRRACIERIGTGLNQAVFTANLAKEYGALFSRTPLLGGGPAPVHFGPGPHGPVASVVWEVDRGRHLQLVFLVDPLEGFEDGGLAGAFEAFGELADPIDEIIDPAHTLASREAGFRDGITLLIVGGVGRNISLWLNNKQRANWRVEMISAPDLFTLSWTPRMKPLHLWRILAAQDALQQRGIQLHNVNGLLNLVAWSRQLEGHLVPHANIPTEWSGAAASLMIGQNSLLDLRHEVASLWDVHAERDVKGRWVALRRQESPLVPEDDRCPVYAPELIRLTLAACTTPRRTWWCELILPKTMEPELAFQRRAMVTTWMRRAALVIDAILAGLSAGPVLWRCRFDYDRLAAERGAAPMDRGAARKTIHVTTDPVARVIEFGITAQFDVALFNAENIAEQALVEALLDGAWGLAGEMLPAAKRDALLLEVVPDTLARQSHIFSARDFRDHIDALQHARVLTISQYDDAYLKIGLGWRVRDMKEGGEVTGKPECIAYLNGLVEDLEDQLCVELRGFNRRGLVDALLSNYERAAQQRSWWRRTAAAQLSLHIDKKAVLAAMGRNETKLNGVFQATRILLEMAVCECPAASGLLPGDLDLTRLMVHANTLFAVGGWSDAIRWDVMPPRLVIRPLGDIHVHADFFDQVLDRFGQATSDQRFIDSAAGYARNLEVREGIPTAEIAELDDFADAWQREFGFSIDDVRRFLDIIEDRALGQQQFIMAMRRSECVRLVAEGHPTERIVDLFVLASRPSWREVPEGFRPMDRQPWRFRRRLSVLRRPMLQVDDDPDPTLVMAPGLLREAFGYTLQNYYRGDYPDWQLGPAMLAWFGRSRHKRGMEFNAEVAVALRALGWQVEPEIKLTKVLRRALDRDYGDIDVLAWDPARNRILVIECKDVQYRKTPGEVAEQLSDFRGEMLPNGKPDLLRKHLDRVAVLKQHGPAACAYLQMPPNARIESHLVFKNPVPMQFVASREGQVKISLLDDLMNI
jgi:hypothetical protein